jgi:serine/threonine protein kinase
MSDLLNPNEIINNRYSVIKSIAKGGIGHTFLAKDTKAQGLVALKLLFAEDIKDWKELELFQREIKVLVPIT